VNQDASHSPKGLLVLAGNWLGLGGLAVSACSLLALLCLIAIDLFFGFDRPYLGVIIYIILPGLVLAGFLLTAIGIWRQRRLRKTSGAPPPLPHFDLNNPRHRRNLLLAAGIIFVFLLFSAFGSYRAYQVTESVAFCGLLCHQVMEPVHTAYLNSPHARVACTKCHIGPGASWYVRTKISGLRQVYAVLTNSYPRPIPVPVENLRPARETCEQCHWPEKFYGSTELLRRHFRSDADNTPFEIRMLLKVGGANPRHGPVGGIHWHMVVGNDIEYLPEDRSRQTIPWVRVTNRETGKTVVYRSPDSPPASQPDAADLRRMDCIDCHNRPTHIFQSPNEALDVALWLERIDDSVPSIKLNAAQALVQGGEAASQSDGLRKIADLLSLEYADYPDPRKIDQAIEEARNIFRNNFFPEMNTDWRVRPDNIGHFIWTGCFRCHDGSHVSEAGETITSDCNACHAIVAQGKPAETGTGNLSGLDFDHPAGMIPPGLNCNLCHSGSP
jgi:nitrate/TMAO reductase-like tetraheme cytochrome c subunit